MRRNSPRSYTRLPTTRPSSAWSVTVPGPPLWPHHVASSAYGASLGSAAQRSWLSKPREVNSA